MSREIVDHDVTQHTYLGHVKKNTSLEKGAADFSGSNFKRSAGREKKFDVESIGESCEQIRCFLQRYESNEQSNLRGFARIGLLQSG